MEGGGFSARGGFTRWCKVDLARVDFRAGRMRKNARAGGEQEKLVSVKWGTDEETDNIVKAYDPRSDLLLLEGEENNMQN